MTDAPLHLAVRQPKDILTDCFPPGHPYIPGHHSLLLSPRNDGYVLESQCDNVSSKRGATKPAPVSVLNINVDSSTLRSPDADTAARDLVSQAAYALNVWT